MSLRRSARNSAKAAVPEVQKGPDLNGQTSHATSVVDADGDAVRGEDFHVPLPESRAKNNVRKKARVTTDAEVTKKKAATPKKASAPRKRKALAIEPEASTGMITNVANLGEVPAGTDASPELVSKESPEVLASTNGVKPSEILTVPNGSSKFNGSTSPSSRHDPLSASDIPRSSEKGINHPSTPVSKRQRKANSHTKSPLKPVPFTPTPSDVDPIAGSRNTARTARKSKPKAADHMLDNLASVNRPAAADVTNAPVLTPRGSQVVVNDSPARKRKAADLPPDVGSPLKPANSTTETLLRDAEAFLIRVDETGKLEGLIEKQHCKLFSPEGLSEVVDPFTALASGIMGQQVSGAAAASIRKKFTALFSDTHPAFPSPSAVLTKDIPALRTAGLSQRKAEYITGLAEKFASGEFTAEGLVSASDEELVEKLVAVRGLGRWSVEMFACFGLKRTDVFSTGDLGVQRGMAAYMGRDVSKLKNKGGKWKYMSEQEMLSIASKFSPYRCGD